MKREEANTCERCNRPIYHLADFVTNQDDTINTTYCRNCCQKGHFVDHDMTIERRIRPKRPRSQKDLKK